MNHHAYIAFRTQEAEQKIRAALSRVRRALTLGELVRGMRPSLPPEIRGMRSALPGMRNLESQARQRAENLATEQLAKLRKISESSDLDEFDKALNQLRSTEWVHLRGNFPAAAQLVERESALMRRTLKERKKGDDAFPVTPARPPRP